MEIGKLNQRITIPNRESIKVISVTYENIAEMRLSFMYHHFTDSDKSSSGLNIKSLEVFENIAFVMAKHADPENVPDNPDEFLEQFNTFSIYEILPQLIEL